MELPKFRQSVLIEFSSLRNGIGCGGGVVLDIDTVVTRMAYRTKTPETTRGWKWQIRGINGILKYDWNVETDQECLDNCDINDVKIIEA